MENNTWSCCAATRRNQQPLHLSNRFDAFSTNERNIKNMIFLEGGEFLMGTEDTDANPNDMEGPIRKEIIKPFYIDQYAVTNRQFQEFVKDTKYETDAEKYGWSFVFYSFLSEEVANNVTQAPATTPWWRVVEGAYWFQPEGPGSSMEDRMDHPVIHVSWNDAKAYCRWAGKRLLTEEEWEFAARGGLVQKRYPWGDELYLNGEHCCNIWQGNFPENNTEEDGYFRTAPVDAYQPNGYGLYNMVGNVWEWCENLFHRGNIGKERNTFNVTQSSRAMRGGSYLCHDSYCNRYRVAARTSNTIDSSTGNIGFRCALDVE
ncbi:formylglycine-generating enzyme family protein [Oceanobacillus jeddahense]|uniref:formylglycine-generating enzyme family protein n=1 Tax=Oceanobacillus jeddahense TaxID=1462527 RepID=UPI0005959D98|nr:formylglycine-generating enzyme family protein [Oceanobacillus jeddahense]